MTALLAIFEIFGAWGTTLAVAGGAASIPIIIHLLNRKRFRIVTWAAMKFLLLAQKQNTRKMRLEQLILLLVRCLIVLLIILAMASVMPWAENVWSYFWPEGAGFVEVRSGRTQKVIVLDASLSMNQMVDGKTAFAKARELAEQLVNKSLAGDGFSVLLVKESPVWLVGEVSQDGRKVAGEIRTARPAHGNAAVPAALNAVAAKLAEGSGRFSAREVYFFTDLQQATWQALPAPEDKAKEPKGAKHKNALHEIQTHARTIFVDVGNSKASNLAVTDLYLGEALVTTGTIVPVLATVHNFAKEKRAVQIELHAGRARDAAGGESLKLRLADQLQESLDPGESKTVAFVKLKFDKPGTYAVQVRLGKSDGDDLAADNARSVIVSVRDHVPVLLVNGPQAEDRDLRKSIEFLRRLLNPNPPERIKEAPLRPRDVTQKQFREMPEAELAKFDCIFLCDADELTAADVRRLETHVRRGGGLVVAPDKFTAAKLEHLEKLLYQDGRGLLPARLVKFIQAPAEHYFELHAEEEAFAEPPLKAFADDIDRGSLRRPQSRAYVQAKPADSARVVLAFLPKAMPKVELDKTLPLGDPALVEWNPPLPRSLEAKDKATVPGRGGARYRGKVVLFTSTLKFFPKFDPNRQEEDWSTWNSWPNFLALIQETTRLAVSGRLGERAVVVSQLLEEFLPAQGAELDVQLHFPEGSGLGPQPRRTQLSGEVNIFRSWETDLAGIYRLEVADDAQEYLFAVNFPVTTPDQRGKESDLTRSDPKSFKHSYPDWDVHVVTDPKEVPAPSGGAGVTEVEIKGEMGPKVAWVLLLVVLVLTLAEVVLAWQFGHFSAAAGNQQPAAEGRAAPTIVACIAGFFFLLIAFVLIHNAYKKDFLGFLPDSWRAAFERWRDIPPPAPGEGTRWNLESISFLRDPASDPWLAAAIALLAIALIVVAYRHEAAGRIHPAYKGVLVGLRLFLILLMLAVLLPQLKNRIDRQTWPDVVLLIDDSKSMSKDDPYADAGIGGRVQELGEKIKKRLLLRLPPRLRELDEAIAKAQKADDKLLLQEKRKSLADQLKQLQTPEYRPTRLQLAQALLAQESPDWLSTLVHKRRMKVHIYHLDSEGRAVKLEGGAITRPDEPQRLKEARQAVAELDPYAMKSRLASGIRDIVNDFRGSSLSGIILLTDGVPVHDPLTLKQAAEFAADKSVPLFFIGLGDDNEIRDLKLHDLVVEDPVYVGDRVNFEARLSGRGYKDLKVKVVLKVKDKDGKPKEVDSDLIIVDPSGAPKRIKLKHQPMEVGRKTYIIEVLPPKADNVDKDKPADNPHLIRTIEVTDTKMIRILYIEGMPRYEFRFLKSLLEREKPGPKQKKSMEVKIHLLEADPKLVGPADQAIFVDFPRTLKELEEYDVVILGDADPARLGDKNLQMLAKLIRGDDAAGKRRTGAGLIMVAGPNFAPHAYKNTPLAPVLPIEPLDPPRPKEDWTEGFRPQLTPLGRQHKMFRFAENEGDNQLLLQRLPQMYWYAENFRLKPLVEVLAVHPTVKGPGPGGKLPLVVQQYVGSGRSMFVGFDEVWRWRFREEETRFNNYWIQTMRYLSRTRINRTELRLDRQSTPYRLGEPIQVIVKFPDSPGKVGPKEVKVQVDYWPKTDGGLKGEPEKDQPMTLAKLEDSLNTFTAYRTGTREGKYRFWLSAPDVRHEDPEGKYPEAEASVELPPGELDRLRMDQVEMEKAAQKTEGKFYTIASADQVLEDLPEGFRVSLATARPPERLWNSPLTLALVLFLLTAEWLLRKRKHLL